MDVFKLFGTVIIENKEAIDALEDTKDAAKETSKSVGDMGTESKKSGKITSDSMQPIPSKFLKVAKAGAGVVSAFVAIGTAVMALAESTREYRLEMGKLETAFTTVGHTTEAATETYQSFYSILGETDRAVEVSQHIAKLCASEEEMKAMTDACIGAFALFDDSLPIEGLVEAANETAKTGQITGVLADALNWAGSSESEFQKRLDACNNERERANLIIEEMISLYGEASAAYKENNKDVIAATAAQEKLNAAMARVGKAVEPVSTAFKEGLARSINVTVDAFERLIDPAKAAENALVGNLETAEEAAAKVEELSDKLVKLSETPMALRTEDHTNQMLSLSLALESAKTKYEELAAAEQMAADSASSAVYETADATSSFTTITDQYIADALVLFETFTQTYENIYNKVSGFFDPFEKAAVTVKTNVNDMMAAMQSQVDFNNTYTANLQALKDYGLGSLAEAFQSYGAEGAAYAQTIVSAVEQAGGATTEKGQQIIQGFSDINQQVTESQEGLAQTMALMDGEFETQLQSMNETYVAAVSDLDKSAEAAMAATNTFTAFLVEMNNKIPEITGQMIDFGRQITSSLQSGIGSVTIPVNIQTTGTIPKAKTGLDYVPYDDYLVYLHHGEAVLTKEEATAWRAGKQAASGENNGSSGSGSGGGGVTVNQYIESVPQTPVELASTTAAYFEQARWIT